MNKSYLLFIGLVFAIPMLAANTDNDGSIVGHSINFWTGHQNGEVTQGVRLLGAVRLQSRHKGQEITGLSALAWDKDEEILYALSDQGWLFHFRPVFKQDFLHSLKYLLAAPLHDEQGYPLIDSNLRDAEGLSLLNHNNSIKGDSQLLVSFERKPRVWQFDMQGIYQSEIDIPEYLQNVANYRRPNSALEGIAINLEGEIILAPEHQMQHDETDTISIYFGKQDTKVLTLSNTKISGITAIEYLDSENLLILERSFRKRLFPEIAIRLKKWNFKNNELDTLATFRNNGEFLVDNFEGLTQHKNQRFFMISDDNNNSFQQTILLYFELID